MCMSQAHNFNKYSQKKKFILATEIKKLCFPVTYARGTRPESGPFCWSLICAEFLAEGAMKLLNCFSAYPI